jgi:Zn-dependent protease
MTSGFLLLLVIQLLILLFSVVIHEVAHGAMAYSMGDPTAKLAGRLTLNPIKHLDPFGSVALPLIIIVINAVNLAANPNMGAIPVIGYAKPVPINPYNFRDKKYGSAKSALAGPLANFCVAIFFGIMMRCIHAFAPASQAFWTNFYLIFGFIVSINILLAIFNLIPIPPLDGSHILFDLLPRSYDKVRIFLTQWSMFFLLVFIFWGLDWVFYLAIYLARLIGG